MTDARAVLISGASTGIGRATALRMDRAGWRVFAGVRRPSDGEALVRDASARLTPVNLDITQQPTIDAVHETLTQTIGECGLAGLVNNAAIAIGGPVEFHSLADYRTSMEVNYFGHIAMTQTFLPLIRQARGRIVFTGSTGARASHPFMSPYSGTKHALKALVDALRLEVKPHGVSVSLIEPGAIRTPTLERVKETQDDALAAIPPDAVALYRDAAMAAIDSVVELSRNAIDPDEVAKRIEHALTAKKPKIRYLVGTDAKVNALLCWALSDRAFDYVKERVFSQPR